MGKFFKGVVEPFSELSKIKGAKSTDKRVSERSPSWKPRRIEQNVMKGQVLGDNRGDDDDDMETTSTCKREGPTGGSGCRLATPAPRKYL